jgi:hypothetical protein
MSLHQMADYARAMCLVASGFASVCLGLLWFLGIEHQPKGDWPVQSFFDRHVVPNAGMLAVALGVAFLMNLAYVIFKRRAG